jgi:hypothetical protein
MICTWQTFCEWCGDTISEGDEIFFLSGEKVCFHCLWHKGYVCACGARKNPKFARCYMCNVAAKQKEVAHD